ncbi:MAG: class I SAM-dependent methyltransferase [Trebonia sp.]
MNSKSVAREVLPVLGEFATHPVRVARALPGEWRQRRGKTPWTESDFDNDWCERLHGLLGAPWPCREAQQVPGLLTEIGALLSAKGLGVGRHTYGWYSDADIELCTAIWCSVLHGRPNIVIETGVAHGISSRIVLEALSRNDRGRLWSIDLPHPLNHRLHVDTGVAVTEALRPRWTYLEGESRRVLPSLVAKVSKAELFIHDSLHTAKNTVFEMEQAASVMPLGGVMLVDDIRGHDGFASFARSHPEFATVLCSTADHAAGFGIAVRTESAVPAGSHQGAHPRRHR